MSFTLDVFTISFFSGTFFISFSSPTFIIYLSLCLILCLSLSLLFISLPRSLQTRSLSLFRHVNYPRLFLSLTLSLSPATLTHFTVFCFGRNLSVFLSPSLSFFSHVNRHLSNMYTHYRSLSHVVAFLHAAMLASLILLWCGPHLSLSLPPSLLSLSLQPHSPILLSSVVDATSLPFSLTLAFSLQPHSPTLLSSVGSTASLCLSSATLTVTLLTRTLPPSLSLSLSLQPIMICRTEVSIFPIAAV